MMLPSPSRRATVAAAAGGLVGAVLLLGAGPAQATQYGAFKVHGAIEATYLATCGTAGVLGAPLTNETPTPDTVGRYNAFSRGGSIYWTPSTGAHEVHGAVRDTWSTLAWESGPLGYPITDETSTPGVLGRYNAFQRGSIYWSPATGAHEVYGAIRGAYASVGWEGSALGFPTSGEFAVPGGRMNTFEGGDITWTGEGGAVVHVTTALPPRLAPTLVAGCAGNPPPGLPPVVDYANCTDLRSASVAYAHGIGRPGASDHTSGTPPVTNFLVDQARYDANRDSDRDGDGIACEQL